MSNNLIVQSHIGNLPEYAKVSIDLIKRYADRIGVEYEFYDKVTLPGFDSSKKAHLYYNILEVIYNPKYDQYDDILYLDTDVLAYEDTGNIFNVPKESYVDVVAIPENALGNFLPGFWVADQATGFIKKYVAMDCDIPLRGRPATLEQINTGVVLFTKKGRLKARQNFDSWLPWADDPNFSLVHNNDQPYLNGMFAKHKFNILRIGDEWNMPPNWFKTKPCPKSHFYHFSNSSGKPLILNFRQESPAGKYFK